MASLTVSGVRFPTEIYPDVIRRTAVSGRTQRYPRRRSGPGVNGKITHLAPPAPVGYVLLPHSPVVPGALRQVAGNKEYPPVRRNVVPVKYHICEAGRPGHLQLKNALTQEKPYLPFKQGPDIIHDRSVVGFLKNYRVRRDAALMNAPGVTPFARAPRIPCPNPPVVVSVRKS